MSSVESMINALSMYIVTIAICTAQDPNCLNGLLSSDESVCVPSFCSQVCGTGCGNAGPDGNCCCGTTESSGLSCIFYDAPCIMPHSNPQQDDKDIYGITKIYKSIDPSSLDFDPNWINAPSRSFVYDDPYSTDQLCNGHGSSRTFDIDGTTGIMTTSGSPRYYCYLEHLNVEVTAYAKRGLETEFREYQGFTIGARSNHKDTGSNYCKAQGYYFRLYNSLGIACFVKEFIHSYDSSPSCLIYAYHNNNPCVDIEGGEIEVDKWYGMKFIVQNDDNNNVNLLGYIDYDDGINGGNWQLVLEYTDKYPSIWTAQIETIDEPNCMDTCNYNGDENWNQVSNSIFLRTDYEKNYQWKEFSVREIIPFEKF